MKTIAVGLLSAVLVTSLTSCEDATGIFTGVVGEWGGQHEMSLIFYPDGRVAIKDENGVVPDCRYQYNAEEATIRITRPAGGSTFEGKLITPNRMQMQARQGKGLIFTRKGT